MSKLFLYVLTITFFHSSLAQFWWGEKHAPPPGPENHQPMNAIPPPQPNAHNGLPPQYGGIPAPPHGGMPLPPHRGMPPQQYGGMPHPPPPAVPEYPNYPPGYEVYHGPPKVEVSKTVIETKVPGAKALQCICTEASNCRGPTQYRCKNGIANLDGPDGDQVCCLEEDIIC